MSETSESSASGGIGFTGLLTVLFVGLKLGGVIDWSWAWVLAPLWAGAGLVAVVLLAVVAVMAILDRVYRR